MATSKSNADVLTVVGYCRTSGEGQRDNTSIPRQKEAIEASCQTNGWELLRFYVDECRSGASIAERDAFQEMMRDAANGKFQVVVVFDITRFARDGSDIIGSARTLKRDFGVDVVDTKGQFDNRDYRKTEINFIHAGVSEGERLRIMDRMTGGRIARAREGKAWCSCPPVGRAYDKKGGCWYVTEKGKAIAEVLQRYVAGEPLKPLCLELGISRAAKISEWVLHGQLSGKYRAKFHSPEIGVEEEVEVRGMPEVCPSYLVEKAKACLQHNRTFNRQDVRRYFLSGFIRCGECGKALTGQARDVEVRYYRHVKSDCGVRSVRAGDIEGAVLDHLYNAFLDEPAFTKSVDAALPSDDHREKLEKQRNHAARQLDKVKSAIDRLVDAVANGADVGLLLSKQDQLKVERQDLGRRVEDLDTEIASLPDREYTAWIAAAIRLCLNSEHRGKDWRKLAYEEVRKFLFYLFGETTVNSGTGIFVRQGSDGGLALTFKGQVMFSFDYRSDGKWLNTEHLSIATGKPSPANFPPGAPTDPNVRN